MARQAHPSTALLLSLLLAACGAAGDGNDTSAAPEGSVTVPVEAGNEPKPAEPGNSTQGAEPPSEVALSVSPEETTEDSTVTLALRNGSGQQLGYNLCTSALETAGGGEVPTSRVCTMEIRTLEPGRTDTYRYELPVNMAEGRYRFVAQVERMPTGSMVPVRSNIFTVRAD